jgi:hypothetical protein
MFSNAYACSAKRDDRNDAGALKDVIVSSERTP